MPRSDRQTNPSYPRAAPVARIRCVLLVVDPPLPPFVRGGKDLQPPRQARKPRSPGFNATVSIHLVGFRADLDRRGGQASSPHGLVQELLNRFPKEELFGMTSQIRRSASKRSLWSANAMSPSTASTAPRG
jgi:hypothetical protein